MTRHHKIRFDVTFETITAESAEDGDAADRGWSLIGTPLRDAMGFLQYEGGNRVEADSWPISVAHPPRWFTFYGSTDPSTGETTNYSLHIPAGVTPASRIRLARLLGVIREKVPA